MVVRDAKQIVHPQRFFNENTRMGELIGKDFSYVLEQFKVRIEG
jgi:hypothetical protein